MVRIAAEGDWNSRIAGSVASFRSSIGSIPLGECWSKSCMAWTLSVEVAVLLRPELAIKGAALEQSPVRCDVDRLAFFENEDLIALRQ